MNFQIHLAYQLADNQQVIRQTFALPMGETSYPFNSAVCYLNYEPTRLQLNLLAETTIIIQEISLRTPFAFREQDRIFCNGFQSWTESCEFAIDEKITSLSWLGQPLAKYFGDYWFFDSPNQKGKLHAWSYAYIRYKHKANQKNNITFIGSLNEHTAYTLIEFDAATLDSHITITKDCTGLVLKKQQTFQVFDLHIETGAEKQIFERYFDQLKQGFPTPSPSLKQETAGWTSWYYYYTNVSEQIVISNLKAFAQYKVPIEIFQIDDGWQLAIGDWLLCNKKFPRGLRYLAKKIQAQGSKAGLWLAPFLCTRQSLIFRNHQDWLLKNEKGQPLKTFYNVLWKSWVYVLDFYHPEVRAYLQRVFKQILDVWGFDMVKLDFLYAASLQYPVEKTKGQVMFEVMQWLRERVGNKIILGCGVPLAPAFGQVDYCRIGPDVHTGWEMNLLKWLGSRERVSTILALQNTIARRQLNHQSFVNDPDVSILRHNKNQLSDDQRYTLFLVNQIFGSLQFISDHIGEYSSETRGLYLSQFPLQKKDIQEVTQYENVYYIRFSIGELQYFACCNLSEKFVDTSFSHWITDVQNYLFFNNKKYRLENNRPIIELKPYESICWLMTNRNIQQATLVGTNGHLFPVSEIDMYDVKNNILQIKQRTNALPISQLWLALPKAGLIFFRGKHFVSTFRYGIHSVEVNCI